MLTCRLQQGPHRRPGCGRPGAPRAAHPAGRPAARLIRGTLRRCKGTQKDSHTHTLSFYSNTFNGYIFLSFSLTLSLPPAVPHRHHPLHAAGRVGVGRHTFGACSLGECLLCVSVLLTWPCADGGRTDPSERQSVCVAREGRPAGEPGGAAAAGGGGGQELPPPAPDHLPQRYRGREGRGRDVF